ncbi:type II toxin-antitoxin system HipA family toxin [Pseudoduganella sp. FT26W]|uniref:Type II toxin-antitoxin system HipA family toxin n=1 Tax=Duganella aquatilis TaxID=2666082 RepID=A0A844D857_9BURK|nr:type II toxin-antitoxin system HipA family toxin [Duganella aquatilis]MRW83740.1 type II toxin-antitoxin system HipA family toxin [Duganella aquatilis]
MNGAFVGTWRMTTQGDVLEYAESWLNNEQAVPLSLSLPLVPPNLGHRGHTVRNYFENLLPDSVEIRERLAQRYGARSTGAFDMLAQLGRDCVGALQLLPVGAAPATAAIEPPELTNAEVADVLRAATSADRRSPSHDLRVAIAGAQEKTALLYFDGQWRLPSGSMPSTHILKLPMGLVGNQKIDLRDSIENEWLCSLILRAYGLPVARCEPLQFEDQWALVVERFDRAWSYGASGSWLSRLPQDDVCQAMGFPPALKYESDGGPGIDRILSFLDGALDPERDKRTFFQAQVLFWMLCAPDGHAKNFSFHLLPGGRFHLAPIYDVLSAYPLLGHGPNKWSPSRVKMAMALRSKNTHYHMREIQRRHWIAVAQRHSILAPDGGSVDNLIDDLVARTPEVVAAVRAQLPPTFPAQLSDQIFFGLTNAAARLSA